MALGENRVLAVRMNSGSTGPQEFARQIVEFLTGDHTQPGPVTPWTVIEADDTSRRDTPSGGNSSADDLPVANLWEPSNSGDLPVGSWAVVESADGDETSGVHFQMLIDVVSSTSLQFYLFPEQDFVTGGGTTGGALPSLPTNNFASATWTFTAGDGYIACVLADEGKAIFIRGFPSETMAWLYVGELFNPAVRGKASPERRYVVRRTQDTTPPVSTGESTEWAIWDDDKGDFEDATMRELQPRVQGGSDITDPDNVLDGYINDGNTRFYDVGVGSFATAAEGIYGFLRDVYQTNWVTGSWGQTSDRKIIWFGRASDRSLPTYAFGWDGTRDFPFNG